MNNRDQDSLIKASDFDRSKIKAGIAHIGVGNFHRAHQAFYTHKILANDNQQDWGICGISLLKGDEAFSEDFQSQEGRYTLTSFAPDGSAESLWIESIVEHYFAPANPERVLAKLSSEAIKIVSLTITEGGYNLDENGQFNLESRDIAHDLKGTSSPLTVFGYLIEALRRRRQANIAPFTIMSCDNLQHNGDTAKKALVAFATACDPHIATWIRETVSFPNAMVDRITPAVHEADKKRLNQLTGIEDKVPVFSESFHQWVLEDNFLMGRPQWEKAGVIFTKDVSSYENLKLKLLNGAHSVMAYPSFLAGYTQVHEAMCDHEIKEFTTAYLDYDAGPLCEDIPGIDRESYKKIVLGRFSNPAIKDQLARICGDGISKLAVYLIETISALLKQKKEVVRMAFLLASYHVYLIGGEKENAYPIHEPQLSDDDWKLIRSTDPQDFLKMGWFQSLNLDSNQSFVDSFTELKTSIIKNGIQSTLKGVNHITE